MSGGEKETPGAGQHTGGEEETRASHPIIIPDIIPEHLHLLLGIEHRHVLCQLPQRLTHLRAAMRSRGAGTGRCRGLS